MASKFTSSDFKTRYINLVVSRYDTNINEYYNFNDKGELCETSSVKSCLDMDDYLKELKPIPAYAIVQMLDINEENVLAYFKNRRKRFHLIIKEAFKSKRFDIETGAKVDWDFFVEYSGITNCKNKYQFLRLMKADKISYDELKQFEHLIQSLTTCTTP